MLLLSILSDFIVIFMFDLTFVYIAKYLFEESVIVDRKTVIIILADTVLNTAYAYSGNESHVISVIEIIMSFSLLFITALRGERKRLSKRILAMISTLLTFRLTIDIYCNIVLALILPADKELESVDMCKYNIYVTAVCVIFLVYLHRQLGKKNICLNFGLKTRILLIAFSLLIMYSGGTVIVLKNNGEMSEVVLNFRVILVICFTLIYVVVPAFLIKDRTSAMYETGQKHHEEMLELETKHFQQYKENQEETRRFRHDIVNNLLTVQTLQREGKDRESAEYIDELLGRVGELSPKVVTGSDMLDIIMSSKIETMEQSGISVDIDGVFDRGLNMKSVDMCSVFANALDNAIEACEKTDGDRTFEMRIKRTPSFYVVAMKNSMSDLNAERSFSGTGRFTTKKNKDFHGYGLENIRKTVEKYGGETNVSIENNMFMLNIILPVA